MAARKVLDAERKERIVKLLRSGATVALAAVALGISPTTVYNEYKRDKKFRADCEAAGAICDDAVVSKLYQTAIGGNVTAMIFWLKNRQRAQWRDVQDHDINQKGNVAIRVEYADINNPGSD
jgi:IS30 family transposase